MYYVLNLKITLILTFCGPVYRLKLDRLQTSNVIISQTKRLFLNTTEQAVFKPAFSSDGGIGFPLVKADIV